MCTARIHTYDGQRVDVTARGRTEGAALANAASKLLGCRVRSLHVERPVPGASTRYAQVARRVATGGLSLGARMIAHVDEI